MAGLVLRHCCVALLNVQKVGFSDLSTNFSLGVFGNQGLRLDLINLV